MEVTRFVGHSKEETYGELCQHYLVVEHLAVGVDGSYVPRLRLSHMDVLYLIRPVEDTLDLRI